ncbi:MAG: ChaN family lipoprotein [Magnetococcales bacterium]|nr:ChaN family lipoprotein [Magnetococcales bacterium]
MRGCRLSLMLGMIIAGCATVPPRTAQVEPPILAVETGEVISRTELLLRMERARVIYLGEKHDNPEQHRLQLRIVEDLLALGRRPALGFEFFTREQTGWLMHFVTASPPVATGNATTPAVDPDPEGERLQKRLGWQGRPEWAFYYPLLALARREKLPVFGADLPEGVRSRLARVGEAGLSAVEKGLIPTTGFVHADYRQLMLGQLAEAHCGAASPALLDRLYATWLARNDTMANAITATLHALPADAPVVMILGAGHVAHAMGVFERVVHLNPGIRQFNLGFKEAAAPPTAAAAFSSHRQPLTVGATHFAPEHAYLWFTPPTPARDPEEDPCAAFRQRHPPPDMGPK